jgi:glycosyltransferase involved in cell wall biosynthesis
MRYWRKRAERIVFSLGRIRPQHWFLANSQFTLNAVAAHYQLDAFNRKPIVIYPFADEGNKEPIPDAEKRPIVASLARICRAKKQIEQARMSADLSVGELWILGHADLCSPYYKQLEQTLEALRVNRAFVFPNLPFDMVQERLRQCRYFLHTTIQEPFGITTVEGILNGCLPIVHDSGGQREVVPIPQLRFRHLSEVPTIIKEAEANPVQRQEWQRQLLQHARSNFTKEVFAKHFKAYFLEVAAA